MRIGVPLRADPLGWVPIPLVTVVLDRAKRRLDVLPTPPVLERRPNRLGDESAPLPAPNAPVELDDQLVGQAYVQSHGHKLTHDRAPGHK